jgi:ribosomal protein S18 acetylase RimI-like enzyme
VGSTVSVQVATPLGPITVVGVVVAAGETSWTLRRRDGTHHEVRTADITARRDVPPPPSRRASVTEVAQAGALGWRALETARLGDWLLRAGGGFTGRANSAQAVGDPGRPLGAALDAVTQWYAERALPVRLQVVDGGSPEALPPLLERGGWAWSPAVHVMTAELSHVLRAADATGARAAAGVPAAGGARGARDGLPDVRLDDAPDEAWLAAYRQAAGPLPAVARRVMTNHPSVVFASVRDADTHGGARALAVARATVDGRWAGLSAVEVAPDARRRGLARLVSAAALREAGRRGGRQVQLAVQADNDAAIPLYDELGFVTHHDYRYADLT